MSVPRGKTNCHQAIDNFQYFLFSANLKNTERATINENPNIRSANRVEVELTAKLDDD